MNASEVPHIWKNGLLMFFKYRDEQASEAAIRGKC
jgi:hypothetical protein